MRDDYNYETAGLDGFLSRSIDNLVKVNLDSPGPRSRKMAYDRAQVSGSVGDVFRVGNIEIDGINGVINFVTDNSDRPVIRIVDADGFRLLELASATWNWYNKQTTKNDMQFGELPNGLGSGLAKAADGYSIADAFPQ